MRTCYPSSQPGAYNAFVITNSLLLHYVAGRASTTLTAPAHGLESSLPGADQPVHAKSMSVELHPGHMTFSQFGTRFFRSCIRGPGLPGRQRRLGAMPLTDVFKHLADGKNTNLDLAILGLGMPDEVRRLITKRNLFH
jgi:hypothetical protein